MEEFPFAFIYYAASNLTRKLLTRKEKKKFM